MQITFTSTPRMSTQEFQSRLRAAWLAIRFQTHPLVACTATSPSNKLDTTGYWLHYPLVDGITATVWANETVICHDHTTGSGLAASLKDAAKTADGSDNNSRAVLHFAPDPVVEGCFHLLFSSGHWITDGRGVFKMFDQMLAILNEEQSDFDSGAKKYAWGEEVKRLSVPLSVAMGQRQARDGDLLPESDEELGAFVKVLMEKEAEADVSH